MDKALTVAQDHRDRLATESITAAAAAAEQRDPLTGFYTQAFLEQRLQQLLEANRSSAQRATFAHIQLQNFCELKSWIGKADANLLLGDLSQLVIKSLPAKVLIARRAKYEFAALLWDEASLNARQIVEDIKTLIQESSQRLSPRNLEIRCDIGLADFNSSNRSADVLYARARHATSVDARQPEAIVLTPREEKKQLRLLDSALRNNRVQTLYQAIISTGQIQGEFYEVRSRLPLEKAIGKESLDSRRLIEVANKFGLGEALDRWLLNHCITVLGRKSNPDSRLVINLTYNSLVSERFIPWLESLLARSKHAQNRLIFQLSEIDVLSAQHRIGQFAEELAALDCPLSINHFGCTDDPFRYLDLFRARFVKLDQSLVARHLASDDPSHQLGETIGKLHDRGLRVAVGMIDDVTLLPHLWRSRPNFLQGFALHKPSSRLDFAPIQEQVLRLP